MPRAPSTFRQGDVTRALKAAAAAGLHVTGYKINSHTGDIEVVTGNPAAYTEVPGLEKNPWDRD